jgi:DNA-binding transcriptional regulator YiaG
MPNVAIVLREEISRLARREIKKQVGSTRQAVAQYRRDIARLKRQISLQDKKLADLKRSMSNQTVAAEAEEDNELSGIRFSSRSVRAQRRRLGLSALDYGKLVGVSALTIYAWEAGKSRPRKAQFAALVAVRGIGKREALKRLADQQQATGKKRHSKH